MQALTWHMLIAASHPRNDNGSDRLPSSLCFDAIYEGVVKASTAFTPAALAHDPSRLAEVRPVLLRLMI